MTKVNEAQIREFIADKYISAKEAKKMKLNGENAARLSTLLASGAITDDDCVNEVLNNHVHSNDSVAKEFAHGIGGCTGAIVGGVAAKMALRPLIDTQIHKVIKSHENALKHEFFVKRNWAMGPGGDVTNLTFLEGHADSKVVKDVLADVKKSMPKAGKRALVASLAIMAVTTLSGFLIGKAVKNS